MKGKTGKTIVIKIGGELANRIDPLRELAGEIAGLQEENHCVLIHGGSAELSDLMKRLGMTPVFRDGIRITAPGEMIYVDKVLSGKVNKRLVRIFQSSGLNAVGLSGADGRLFSGEGIAPDCRTGEITRVDLSLLNLLLGEGYFPVISSTSMDGEGNGLNVNADSVALKLAISLEASCLVFLSDIPGLLIDGEVIRQIDTIEALRQIEAGAVTGGMIPKLKASLGALKDNVETILIGEFLKRGDLRALLDGRIGTRILEKIKEERI